ncbi:MAG: Trm112 family protein [Magnetococcales bacterium]|nr:Trm112 family protein [Magnetococcales bacterium]
MDKELLEILVCPQCKGSLEYDSQASELICQVDRLAFAIRDDIPVMLVDDAREIEAT